METFESNETTLVENVRAELLGQKIGLKAPRRIGDRVQSSTNPLNVAWSSIRMFRSLEICSEVLRARHQSLSEEEHKESSKAIATYIDHAYEYFQVASGCSQYTAPLLYYYSFLNLAKALVESRKPNFRERPSHRNHGLSSHKKDSYKISATPNPGVFQELNEVATGIPFKDSFICGIKEIFRMIPPIDLESRMAFKESASTVYIDKIFASKDELSDKYWMTLGFNRQALTNAKTTIADIIQTPGISSSFIPINGNMPSPELYIQSNNAFERHDSVLLEDTIYEHAKHWPIYPSVMRHTDGQPRPDFYLMLQKNIACSDPLSSTCILFMAFFWLGSIVRYDPSLARMIYDSNYVYPVEGLYSQCIVDFVEQVEWLLWDRMQLVVSSR